MEQHDPTPQRRTRPASRLAEPGARRPKKPRAARRSGPAIPVTGGWWPIATGIALVALLGMIVWNVNLRDDVADLNDRLAIATGDLTDLRSRANASVYQLLPTSDAPDNANAQAWFSIQGSGVLSVANLPVLAEGRTYQLWYMTDNPNAPVPGGTFSVDETGQGFMLIPADVTGVTSIAITEEATGGAQEPTGPVLLSSDIDGARG